MNAIIAEKHEEAEGLIEEGKLDDAITKLEPLRDDDTSGEVHALLGIAYFRTERYAEAEGCLRVAHERDPSNLEWSAMRDRAHANALADVATPVPEIFHHDRETLLAPPSVTDDDLPGPPAPIRKNAFMTVLGFVGTGVGKIATLITHAVVNAWGKLKGYTHDDRPWTNWDTRKTFTGILTLAYMRDLLNKNNLKTTYPKDELIGFQPSGQRPPRGATHFRTADGTWNNLKDPKEGAAGTRFPRNVENGAIHPESGTRLLHPNPRDVSRKLLRREGDMAEVPFLNMLAASWIQFQNHDWVSHGENLAPDDEPYVIPLGEDDPARARYHQKEMRVARTQPDPTRRDGAEPTPITYINEVTHWWDGSQIYGSDQATQDRLRSHVDGKLKLVDDDRHLPLNEHGVEDTGFNRNWWVGMSMLHTLFVKEHNAICDRLKQKYPQWDDNRLFNVARLINAAVMAKIHTVEWTPAVLPNETANLALNANWFGIFTHKFRRRKNRRAKATLNIVHPETGGVVGNPIDKHGSPYGLTEEFVEVYRLHSFLPEELVLKSHESGVIMNEIPLPETRQAGSAKITAEVSMADLFYSFGKQHPGLLVLNNYPRFMQELSVPGHPVFDLGAVDILRARERGVPRYNEFRRQLGLKPIKSFDELTSDAEQVQKLREVYNAPGSTGDNVEDLDLLVGTLGEQHPNNRPKKFGFGETLFQIFILNATRRLQADRFYTECYNEETYTKEGMDWVDDADLKTVILRHYPELGRTGLANVRNAFEPWDEERQLDPARHPLREYDAEIKDSPWIGDRYRNPPVET